MTFDTNGTGSYAVLNGVTLNLPRFPDTTGILCTWSFTFGDWSIVITYGVPLGLQLAATNTVTAAATIWGFLPACCAAGVVFFQSAFGGGGFSPTSALISPGPCG